MRGMHIVQPCSDLTARDSKTDQIPLALLAPTSAAAKSYLFLKAYRAHDSPLTASLGLFAQF